MPLPLGKEVSASMPCPCNGSMQNAALATIAGCFLEDDQLDKGHCTSKTFAPSIVMVVLSSHCE